MSINPPTQPRPEHPRPQFVRPHWLNLNGLWQFEIDASDSGLARGVRERPLSGQIMVPFCPESELSGVGHKDFMNAVWYRREITVPGEWPVGRVQVHFGAVDQDATVWIFAAGSETAIEVARHRGGFTPFTADLSGLVGPGQSFTLVLRARDFPHVPQARGKQSDQYAPHTCLYTRTTGIWQTVWLENVPEVSLKRPRITPNLAAGAFHIELPVTQNKTGWQVRALLSNAGREVCRCQARADLDLAPSLNLVIPADQIRTWNIVDPFLYDLRLELLDEKEAVVDAVVSYAGLRSVSIDGWQVKINGEPVFQKLILDQGYYPDGVMTAPADEALVNDIKLSQDAGFNGARLHQKVFEERFLFHADRLGYLVWGEFGDWGCGGYGPNADHQQPGATYITQWLEAVERDYSHPAIIGWCPLNETWQETGDGIQQLDDVTRGMFLATKSMDTSRPVLDTSGYAHRVTESDIYDAHDYIGEDSFEVGLANMRERHAHMSEGKVFVNMTEGNRKPHSVLHRGQPYFVSEFGGFKWLLPDESTVLGQEGNIGTWGYGSSPGTIEEFYHRFEAVCRLLLDNPHMFGYCYTQLTDIFPEQNGLYTFDRRPKFDNARLHGIQQK